MKKLFVCLFVLCVFINDAMACRGGSSKEELDMREAKSEQAATLIFKGKITSLTAVLTGALDPVDESNQGRLDYRIKGDITSRLTFKITKIIKGKYDKPEITVYWANVNRSTPFAHIRDFINTYGEEAIVGVDITKSDKKEEDGEDFSNGTHGLSLMNNKSHPFSNDPDIEHSYWILQPNCFAPYIKNKDNINPVKYEIY